MTTSQLAFLERLQLGEEAEERDIRRAYARELKRVDQETDPAGFQSLREAYEIALQWAAWKRQQQEAVPAEPSASPGGQAPVAAGKDPTSAVSAEAIADPNVFGAVPEATADEVFAEFVARSGSPSLAPAADSDRLWQRELESCLDDPRLIHVTARDIFEWHVAVLLAQGWRAGHEALLVAAVRVFDWSDDRKRLLRFGRPGEIVNRAIEERVVFDQQPDQVRAWQRDVIVRLRNPAQPSHGELIGRMALAEAVVAQFPVWVPLITSMENLQSWRQLNDKVPGWRRKLSFRRRLPRINVVKPGGKPVSGKVPIWWIVVGFLTIFRAIMGDPASTTGKQSSPLSQTGSYSLPGTGSSALDVFGLAKGNYLPAAPSGTNPYRPADGGLYGQGSPDSAPPVPPSKAQLLVAVRGKPTSDKCSEVGRLAALYQIGTARASAQFGPAFDRQVIACVNARLWPRPTYQDPAILSAVNNELARSKAEIAARSRDITAGQKPVPQPANAAATAIPEALWKPAAAENQAPDVSREQPWILKSTADKYRLDAKE